MNQLIQSVCLSMSVINNKQHVCRDFVVFHLPIFRVVSFFFILWFFFRDTNQMQIDLFLGFFSLLFFNHTKNSYTMNHLINEKVLIVLSCGWNVKWMCHHFYSFSQRHRACFILHHRAVHFVLIFMSILVAVRSAHKILKL